MNYLNYSLSVPVVAIIGFLISISGYVVLITSTVNKKWKLSKGKSQVLALVLIAVGTVLGVGTGTYHTNATHAAELRSWLDSNYNLNLTDDEVTTLSRGDLVTPEAGGKTVELVSTDRGYILSYGIDEVPQNK